MVQGNCILNLEQLIYQYAIIICVDVCSVNPPPGKKIKKKKKNTHTHRHTAVVFKIQKIEQLRNHHINLFETAALNEYYN